MSGHLQWTGKPKVPHPAPEDAEQHRLELLAKDGRHAEVYKCYTCNAWHVGHPTTKVKWYERSTIAREDMLVGKLIGVLRASSIKKK